MVHYCKLEFLWKDWIVVFKAKVRVKVQNFIACLLILHFQYDRSFATKLGVVMYSYQLADQVQTKWAYTDSRTVTYSITQHMMGVTPACLYLVYPNFHPCVFVYVF